MKKDNQQNHGWAVMGEATLEQIICYCLTVCFCVKLTQKTSQYIYEAIVYRRGSNKTRESQLKGEKVDY